MLENIKSFFKEAFDECTVMSTISFFLFSSILVLAHGGFPDSKEGSFITCLLMFIFLDVSYTRYQTEKIFDYIEKSKAEVDENED